MEKAIGYVRVSPHEETEVALSIQVQTDRLMAYCRSQALDPMLVIRDEGVYGNEALDRRLGGQDLLRIVSTAGVQHVVVVRLDRLFRHAREAYARTQAWLKEGIHLHIVDMGGHPISTRSEAKDHFIGMLGGFAAMERCIASERTSAAIAMKKANRFVYGAIPYGYDLHGNQLIPNDAEQAVIQRVKQWRSAGWTLRRIARHLNEQGVPTKHAHASGRQTLWYASTVRYLLSNSLHDVQ